MKPLSVGVVGCGNISDLYFQAGTRFDAFNIIACTDLNRELAEEKAELYEIPRVLSTDELLADPNIAMVLNITQPKAHAEIAMRAVAAGKHLYNEKPLTPERAEGRKLLNCARRKGVRVGCAPDTVLGAGVQTARKLIDDGWIGTPVSATAFMMCHGHESWHPNPEFYYEMGGGPMFDMGPYYLTALVTLLGPVAHVSAVTRTTFKKRLITSQPKKGKKITVETPTHLTGLIEFENNVVCTMITSFDVWHTGLPCIEIHGTEGSLSVPDPNGFGGEVKVFRPGYEDWQSVPHTHGYADQSRGIGLADMAAAIQRKRKHRANGELSYHVLDVMHAFLDGGDSHRQVVVKSTCKRPEPMPMLLPDGQVEVPRRKRSAKRKAKGSQ
ncbi:MAG: Gfo/Idh/MocA family oxidoreductase [Candidatus Hydrogenedentes bacterium]|nr:Gfo/Idh/MocA family oxidoreductase [Candidatus Hydrogenedentota bacterium]